MSASSSTVRKVDATVVLESATTPNIVNLPMATAGTEYSYALTANVKQMFLKARNKAILQLAYIAGDTGLTYVTVKPGAIYTLDAIKFNGIILYLQSNKDSTIVEIQELI